MFDGVDDLSEYPRDAQIIVLKCLVFEIFVQCAGQIGPLGDGPGRETDGREKEKDGQEDQFLELSVSDGCSKHLNQVQCADEVSHQVSDGGHSTGYNG